MKLLKGIAFAVALVVVQAFAFAIQMDDGAPTEPGFQADRVYQVSNPDSIDLSTGTLTLTIPIGQEYPVGGGFSYRLMLSYNSNVWEFDQRIIDDCQEPPCWYRQAFPNPRSNAGLGWRLSLGHLYSPWDTSNPMDPYWVYVGPDGAEHRFFERMYSSARVGISTYGPWTYHYTRDGSYLRMKFQEGYVGQETRYVEFPDGSQHVFVETGASTNMYRLERIQDANGNGVTITDEGSRWVISDDHNRQHYVNLVNMTVDGQKGKKHVSSIQLAAFSGATATYTFRYQNQSIRRSLKDNDPQHNQDLTVPLLIGIDMPDGTSYSMPVADSYWVNNTEELRDRSGLIKKMVFPTKGYVKWLWQRWETPGAALLWPCTDPEDVLCGLDFYADWAGILQKTYRRRDDSGIGAWTYTTWTGWPVPGSGPNDDLDQERRTIVKSPAGNDTVYYFRALPTDALGFEEDMISWDYALPFTRRLSVTGLGSRTLYLSEEVYDGAVQYGDPEHFVILDTNKKRSTYVRYENTSWRDPPEGLDPTYRGVTRHKVAERAVHHDDGGKYRETAWFDFDGHGNFRTVAKTSNYNGAKHAKTYTYNYPYPWTWGGTLKPLLWPSQLPDTSTYDWGQFAGLEQPGDDFKGMLPASQSWILHTHSYAEQFEKNAEGVTIRERTDLCFDDFGRVTRSRVRESALTPGSHDLITKYIRNADGSVWKRRSYGSDNQPVETSPDLCSMTLPGFNAGMNFTYQYGTVKTATPMATDSTSMGYFTHDWDIDQYTGRPTTIRDTAGVPTNYEFDTSGRLTWIKPDGSQLGVTEGAWTQYCYFSADNDPGVDGYAKVEVLSRPSDTTPICTNTSNALARSSSVYDDIGRLYAEYTLLPGAVWNQRRHQFDGMNRKAWETEWQAQGATLAKTEYDDFDYLNRPQTITPPDGSAHAVTVEYTGDRIVSRTATVATWRNGTTVNEDSVTVSTQEFDGLGHLYKLTEPVGGHNENFTVTATYTWDVGGRLRKVAIPWGGFTQTRTWNYDGRGFLTSEVVPEKGIDGYGFIQYSNYNVFGQAGTTVDGSNILTNTYDDAGRLTKVHDSVHEDPIREYEYSTENSDENLSKGKLLSQVAHNYFDAENDFLVRETMTYGGRDGRISLLATVAGVQTVCGVREFRQEYEWTPLGDVATVSYPRISNGETPLDVNGPVRLVKNSFDAGFLVGVSDQTTQTQYGTISYHPNTMVSTVQFGTSPASSLSYVKDPNDMARPASISSSTGWATGTYEYDGIGNIKAMRRSALDADTFVYDKASRLKEARFKVSSAWKTESYTHDGWGNIETKTTNGDTFTYNPDAAGSNHIDAPYDASGNLIELG